MAAERRRDKQAIAELAHGDYPRLVRVGAVQSLRKNFGGEALRELGAALASESDDVRMSAARALASLHDETAAEILRGHVDDPVDDVACWCVSALPQLANHVAIPLAIEALGAAAGRPEPGRPTFSCSPSIRMRSTRCAECGGATCQGCASASNVVSGCASVPSSRRPQSVCVEDDELVRDRDTARNGKALVVAANRSRERRRRAGARVGGADALERTEEGAAARVDDVEALRRGVRVAEERAPLSSAAELAASVRPLSRGAARTCRGPKVPRRRRSLAAPSRVSVAAGVREPLDRRSRDGQVEAAVEIDLFDVRDDDLRIRHGSAWARAAIAAEKSTATISAAGKRARRCAVSVPVPQPSSRIVAGCAGDARRELEREPVLDGRVRVVGRGRTVEVAADLVLV